MSKKSLIATAVGTAFVAGISAAPLVSAAENPFALSGLASGYQVADAHGGDKAKMKDGKCGEGKCGGDKAKMKDGKCGEGKCGGDKAKMKDGKCGGDKAKMKDGKCGEGKCGGTKK